MKLHHDIAHSGTLDGDKEIMGLDENSLAVIQNMFIDLYEVKPRACVREYFTNAWDGHVAAGILEPVEVELPTSLRPVLIIRDHGVGLTLDEMRRVYFQYGASDKRDTDEQTGQLGMGSKSALTYTSQFTVTGIKDGIKTVVLVTREADGRGAFLPIGSEETDERNGVEIEIPVSNVSEMVREAHYFFQFVDSEKVLIDGERPIHYKDAVGPGEALQLDPDVYLVPNLDSDYIVMGNVPYPCKLFPGGESATRRRKSGEQREMTTSTIAYSAYRTIFGNADLASWSFKPGQERMRVVCHVPIGAINFTPSREAVALTSRSEDVIDELQTFVRAKAYEMVQFDVDSQPNHHAGLKKLLAWKQKFANMPLTYRGIMPPNSFQLVPKILRDYGSWKNEEDDGSAWSWDTRRGSDNAQGSTTLHHTVLARENIMFVTGYKGRGVREETKNKLRRWLVLNGYATEDRGYFEMKTSDTNRYGEPLIRTIIFINEVHFPTIWLNPDLPMVPFEEIKSVEMPKAKKEPADKRYRVLDMHGNEYLMAEESINSANLVYVMAQERQTSRLNGNDVTALMDFGATVVVLPANRKSKFLRTWPTAETVEEFVRRQVKETIDTISSEAALLMVTSWQEEWNHWRSLAAPSIRKHLLDKDLAGLLARLLESEPQAIRATSLFQVALRWNVSGSSQEMEDKRAPARRAFGTVKGQYSFISWMPTNYRPKRSRLAQESNREPSRSRQLVQILNNEYVLRTQVHLDPRTY